MRAENKRSDLTRIFGFFSVCFAASSFAGKPVGPDGVLPDYPKMDSTQFIADREREIHRDIQEEIQDTSKRKQVVDFMAQQGMRMTDSVYVSILQTFNNPDSVHVKAVRDWNKFKNETSTGNTLIGMFWLVVAGGLGAYAYKQRSNANPQTEAVPAPDLNRV